MDALTGKRFLSAGSNDIEDIRVRPIKSRQAMFGQFFDGEGVGGSACALDNGLKERHIVSVFKNR